MIVNFKDLNAEMGRNKLSIPKLAKIVGLGKKAMYERFHGDVQFSKVKLSL